MTSNIMIDFSKKAIVFITGASRGIGRTLAIEICRKLKQSSILVLIARSKAGLEETKFHIGEINKSVHVDTVSLDLSKPDINEYNDVFKKVLSNINTEDVKTGIIFHNAGHVATIKQTTDLTDLAVWRKFYDMNLFSCVLLNNVFIKSLRPVVPKLVVINITSLTGHVPLKNLSMYGSGKAARELFFKVLALEEPNIIVLNYSPGPVDTDMFHYIAETAQSEDLRQSFNDIKNTIILTTIKTVNRMLNVLEKGDYKSGDTVDFYDRL
ncbi:sepiapterin reductase-like [Diabrotica virgifera virgifera]|uniref:Sepiapterin reductase n=1 Tax=Diabrotica virgifera virgifera TaxID=50390 RepID=A0ABM5IG37_DIAVI|nr:sepiapterin reductase-like [Diabrotica virgifera virgifera]